MESISTNPYNYNSSMPVIVKEKNNILTLLAIGILLVVIIVPGIKLGLSHLVSWVNKNPDNKNEKFKFEDDYFKLPKNYTEVIKSPDIIYYQKGNKTVPKRNKNRPLGRGNVSETVYEQKNNPAKAIKILKPPLDLEREYEMGTCLQHPVINKTCHLYCKGTLESPEKYKMVMDKVSGKTIENCEAINDELVIKLIRQAKSCCLYLFRTKIIYWADLNHGNIFIDRNDDLKLIDFGWWSTEIDNDITRTLRLLCGSMQLVGWIIQKSNLVAKDTGNNNKKNIIRYPQNYFGEQINTQIFTDIDPMLNNDSWFKKAKEKLDSVKTKDQLERFLADYFDQVLIKFEQYQ